MFQVGCGWNYDVKKSGEYFSPFTRIRQWRILPLSMVIVETSVFTRQVSKLLTDDEYRELQTVLINRPNAGPVII